MSKWQTLADAILDEDRILRGRLTAVPTQLRDRRGPDGSLSYKKTLAHLAYWDDFTVRFFTRNLDPDPVAPPLRVDFVRQSEKARQEAGGLTFGQVMARYLDATGALVGFIARRWDEMSEKQREDFWLPLEHRRHHREILFRALDARAVPREPLTETARS